MRRLRIILAAALAVYGAAYAWFRSAHVEVWERDGRAYVIFPANKMAVYYLFRPPSTLDGRLTGMRFHIGPHR